MDLWRALKEDHGTVDRLFRRLAGTGGDEVEDRERLFTELRTALDRHSRAEEQVLYPALGELAETRDRVPTMLEDHARAMVLLQELAETPKGGHRWGRRCAELDRAVARHVRFEEDVLLPAARQAIGERRAAELLRRFEAAKSLA